MTITGEDSGLVGVYDKESLTYKSPFAAICEDVEVIKVQNCTLKGSVEIVFANLDSLRSVEFTNVSTVDVTDMSYMFFGCYSLSSLDLSNFDLNKTTDVEEMLYKCDELGMICTPKTMKSNYQIDLPVTFFDSKKNKTTVITVDFCNDILFTEEKLQERERQVRELIERIYTIVLSVLQKSRG